AELAGHGVPSIERAAMELYYSPVHTPLREALAVADSDVAEKLGHLSDGLAWMLGKDKEKSAKDAAPIIERAVERAAKLEEEEESDELRAWIYAEAALDLLASTGPALAQGALIDA